MNDSSIDPWEDGSQPGWILEILADILTSFMEDISDCTNMISPTEIESLEKVLLTITCLLRKRSKYWLLGMTRALFERFLTFSLILSKDPDPSLRMEYSGSGQILQATFVKNLKILNLNAWIYLYMDHHTW